MAAWSSALILVGALLTRYRLPVIEMGSWLSIDPNVPEGKELFDILTDFAMFGAVIFETMAVLSIFIFRRRFPDAPRPYRCWGYPLTPALYVILPAFILTNMFVRQRTEALIGLGFIALGTALYGLVFRGAKHLPLVPGADVLAAASPEAKPESRFQ